MWPGLPHDAEADPGIYQTLMNRFRATQARSKALEEEVTELRRQIRGLHKLVREKGYSG